MDERRKSIPIRIGDVIIGGNAPISVQSMANTDTRDVKATVSQISELAELDCEIVRLAVPDMQAAEALSEIKKQVSVPLIADIHFDHRLALAALEAGIDGLRLNPGNIGEPDNVKIVVKAAAERDIPIRIGVNAGSMPKKADLNLTVPQRMVEAAMEHIRILEDLDFFQIKVSLKAFDVPITIAAYRDIAAKIPYPLHIGITEAGTPRTGIIRSSAGIGALLSMGIGDTIRVSLTTNPREEVITGYEILKSLNLRQHGPVMVSCPTCGRTEVDLVSIAEQIEKELLTVTKPVKVAVMGCIVNGPGEAKEADVGIACGKGRAILFKKGEQIRTIEEKDFVKALMEEIESL